MNVHDLFSIQDEGDLCDEIFCAFPENEIDVERYGEVERVITLVWHASGIIENGGFYYLFQGNFNGDPGFVYTAAAFKKIGANKAYVAFQEAMRKFPGGILPENMKERLRLYEDVPEKEQSRIDGLFYEDSGSIECKLAPFIRENRDEIITALGNA